MAAREDKQGGDRMDEKKPPVIRSEWEMMARHMDKLRGQLEESRRWCMVQSVIIALLAGALTYTLMCGV